MLVFGMPLSAPVGLYITVIFSSSKSTMAFITAPISMSLYCSLAECGTSMRSAFLRFENTALFMM